MKKKLILYIKATSRRLSNASRFTGQGIFCLPYNRVLDRQPNQKVPLNAFYLLFPNKLMYMVTIDGSQSLIASHTIIRKTCPDHSEE